MIISSQRVQFDNQTCDIEIMLDITERKRAQDQALALSLERERVNFITQFIRSASHEFRTPLSVIATSTYLLTRASDPARFRSHAERIDGQVKRLIRLLDMLLLMAQLDSSSTIPMLPVVLNTLIDQAKTASFTEQTEKRLQVTTSYPSEVLQTKGDTAYLRQMLNLLMENAVRYTPEGGAISVSLSESAGQAVIEVRDTGSGISEEYMPLIFELLWRQDEAHTESGFGLGLPIVKRIVDLHRGSISISSKIDEGTAVIIHLPLVDAS
jgi:signal transduction histidine kinase